MRRNLLLLLIAVVAVVSCRAPAGPRPNVLLITVDTLRPDHLGCLGYLRPTSPAIDALAARGVVFRQAVTAAGRTVQSFPSILTGVNPPTHGLRYEGQSTEPIAGRLTLTRALKEAGYDAFAVTQGLNVGLHRDFDVYDPDIYLDPQGKKVYVPTRNDFEATQKALQWLRGRRGRTSPFFLWLRYNAPHWPYDPPAPYAERFDPDYKGAHTFNEEAGPGVERGDLIFGKTRLSDREVQHAVAHYDGEVAYADAAIAELLRGLDALGGTEKTIVVLTADHGESLGEHDYFFEHGAYLYEPTVRVPLIVVAPGRLPAGRKVETLGRTIDIVPTVLDLAGVDVPIGLDGVSLVAWARGESKEPGRPAYSESGRNFYPENPRQKVPGVAGKWRMMRDDRWKLLLIPDDPEPQWELYDLQADPGERRNVLAEHPTEADRLRRLLLAIVSRDPLSGDRGEPALPDGLEDKLRSLGYVGGGPGPKP
ncbi:MAG TPA: sulfatase [Candidatus Polarisedimenticolia bacterium]|nr:sulfatase [Candidatus Polarisedimenticolia bacterium]